MKIDARDALDRLADALVDDVLAASDQEVLAEVRETGGDPDNLAGDMRAQFERSVLAADREHIAKVIIETTQVLADGYLRTAEPSEAGEVTATALNNAGVFILRELGFSRDEIKQRVEAYRQT